MSEEISVNALVFGVRKTSLNKIQVAKIIKNIIDNYDYIKIYNFCLSKDTTKLNISQRYLKCHN